MEKLLRIFIFAFPFFYLAGCQPDLKISKFDIDWNDDVKKVNARIKNTGGEGTGPFTVNINAIEEPTSINHRPVITKEIPNLGKNDYIDINADFAPLAHPDNADLKNVKKIQIVVDPTGMVKESNKNNNTEEKSVP
ncbi:MAG: CARDB domain-containing protein [Phycisphaerales bacterium]